MSSRVEATGLRELRQLGLGKFKAASGGRGEDKRGGEKATWGERRSFGLSVAKVVRVRDPTWGVAQ